jgi:ribosomal protein S18 acetylase RimI-like enzyme
MLEKRIEEVSLNAWPASQQIFFDGWILRFANGYTRRANSVNPLFGSSLNVEEKIRYCERLYTAKSQSTIFRLTHFAAPPELDQALAKRHYERVDLTHVQYRDLKQSSIPAEHSVEFRNAAPENWLEGYHRVTNVSLAEHRMHKELLQRIPTRRLLAQIFDSGKIVACGLGVLEADYFGLFDLVTDPKARNQGYGGKLVLSMLRWAQENSASHAYLQVLSSNAAARYLYTKIGFKDLYEYWYRVPKV